MIEWTVATCNTRGINDIKKQKDIIEWHEKTNNTISIITEIRINSITAKTIRNRFTNTLIYHSADDEKVNSSGVAIIVNKEMAAHIHKISEVAGRCITLILRFKRKVTIAITAIYNKSNNNKR